MTRSLYEILGVSPSASGAEIDAACVRLGEQFHPDRNKGNANAAIRFEEIEQAFEVLCDQEKRKQYDASLSVQSGTEGKNSTPKPARLLWGTGGLIAVLLLAAALFLMFPAQQVAPSVAPKVIRNEAEVKDLVTSLLKDQASSSLKDPSSARFRNMHLYKTTLQFKSGEKTIIGERTLCGEMNGKDAFGAYIGFRSFYSSAAISLAEGKVREGTHVLMISDPQRGQRMQTFFRKSYSEFCRDKTVRHQDGKWVEVHVIAPVAQR